MPPGGYKKFEAFDFHAPTACDLYGDGEVKVIVGRSMAEESKEWKTLSEVIGHRPLNRSERRKRK